MPRQPESTPGFRRQEKRRGSRIGDRDRLILGGPALVLITLMVLGPLVFTLYLSVHEWSGGLRPPEFVGLENYTRMVDDPRFWGAIWRSLYFVGLSITLQTLIGVAAAMVFHQTFRGRAAIRVLFLFPMIATPAAMALVWKMMLDPTIGILGYLSNTFFGGAPLWTSDPDLVIPTLAMVDTWTWAPLVMIIVLAGLAALPQEPFEAAKLDGANGMQTFFSITLPLLKPVIVVAVLFRVIDCIKTFDLIVVLTGGGPNYGSEILNIYAFTQSLTYFDMGYGGALLVALIALVLLIAYVLNAMRKRADL